MQPGSINLSTMGRGSPDRFGQMARAIVSGPNQGVGMYYNTRP